ncbi:MAG: HAMP domain-containing sensor histidine kinase [Caldimonas sp.]
MADEALAAGRRLLADDVRAHTSALIAAWRSAVAADPLLTTGDSLPRAQLEDHLPDWLEALAAVLSAAPGAHPATAEEERAAEAHGLQRWQQGYDLQEVTREWGCLHRCLVVAIERFDAAHPELDREVLAEARLKLAGQISEAVSASAEKYFRLERVEASGSVRDLERALAGVRELERQRAELWQQAAHDLRGNLGVVSNVAHGLNFRDLPAERRQDFLGVLRNNVTALHHLLDDVTALARLQAGQEQRSVARFDAGELLAGLADDMRPLADEKGLYLRSVGSQPLDVQGDRIKVRRIAQNLVLNALKYTKSGGVTVTWADTTASDDGRWFFVVADTGPGFHCGPGAPLVSALSEATTESRDDGAPDAAAPDDDGRPVHQAHGEGLGLAIVKRLCDLLNATVELETAPDQGTTVRVLVPRRYSAAGA